MHQMNKHCYDYFKIACHHAQETGLTALFYHVTSKITNRALDVEIFRTLLEYGADHTKHLRGHIVMFGRELFLQPLKEHELVSNENNWYDAASRTLVEMGVACKINGKQLASNVLDLFFRHCSE